MGKKNREINVFSTSAIDLFASSLGVFIVLVIIIMPYFRKTSEAPPIVLKQKIKEKTEEVVQLQKKIKEIEEELEQTQQKVVKDETEKGEVEDQKRVLQEKVQEIERIQEELQKKTSRVVKLEEQTQEQVEKIEQLQRQIKVQPRREVASKEPTVPLSEFEEQKKIEKRLQNRVKQLQEQLKREEMKRMEGAFVAVVIKWPTQKHDIDLAVKDPGGRVFNFKRRKHKGVPGNFSLDSRTGPGAEIWQAPSLIPGNYELTYSFYNAYGNPEPAEIFGTIFTKDGSVELPKVTMDFKKQRKATLSFKVTQDHGVSLVYK